LAEILAEGGPWGQGFPEPLFDGVFETVSHRVVGEKHLKLVLRPGGDGPLLDGIAFNAAPAFAAGLPPRVLAAYRLDCNEFRGEISLQLRVEHLEPACN
jgi:single-stranded-DNA-specific exonuclease